MYKLYTVSPKLVSKYRDLVDNSIIIEATAKLNTSWKKSFNMQKNRAKPNFLKIHTYCMSTFES